MVDESFFRLQWLGLVMLIVSAALGIGNMPGDIRLGRGIAVPTRVRAVFAAITILGHARDAGRHLRVRGGSHRPLMTQQRARSMSTGL